MIAPFSEIRAAIIALNGNQFYSTDNKRTLNKQVISSILEVIEANPSKSIFSSGNSSAFIGKSNSNGFLLYKAVTQNGKIIGAIIFELSYRTMGYNILTQQRIQQSQTSLLLDSEKQVIYADNYLPDNLLQALITSYLNGYRRTILKIDGKSYFAYMQYSGSSGWIIVSFVPEEKLFSSSELLKRQSMSLWIIGLLISSVFLMILSHVLLRPVKHLKEAMSAVQRGDLTVTIKRSSSDEIGDLSQKAEVIDQIVNFMRCDISTTANLEKIGGSKGQGAMAVKKNTVCKEPVEIINQSVTGLFETRLKL